jgi:hypothetical protein
VGSERQNLRIVDFEIRRDDEERNIRPNDLHPIVSGDLLRIGFALPPAKAQ